MSEKSLHITVAAIPNPQPGNLRILDHELRLTKASILYADRIKLCSMGAWMATSFHLMSHSSMNVAQQLEIMIGLSSALATNSDAIKLLPELHNYLILIKRKPIVLSKKERQKIDKFKKNWPEMWERLRASFLQIVENSGFGEIEVAANKGLLEVYPFSSTEGKNFAPEYLTMIEDMFSSTMTYPMFDEKTSDLVRSALQEGKMSIGDNVAKRSKQVGLVADLFDRLPVFDVKMDELLDLREELRNPLIRFRAEMVNLGSDIEVASWDKDFPADVQMVYQSKIEPALLDIEERMRSLSFRDFWSRRIIDKYGYIAGALGSSYALGAAVAPVYGILAGISAAAVFTEAAISEWIEKTNEVERNGLYFYYKMKKHIEQTE